uniref:Uncharacterized protein n=1 Tax=Helianthus annuus TaxID=4232 RepID=A0A251VM13_HELAN
MTVVESSRRSGVVQATLSERCGYHSQGIPTLFFDAINYLIHMKNLWIKVESSRGQNTKGAYTVIC